jgi:hypothetical protein
MKLAPSLIVLFAFSTVSNAEIFMDIQYDWNISQLKRAFPNAKYEPIKPAWEKPNQFLVSMTGKGIPGNVSVLFEHQTYDDCVKFQTEYYKRYHTDSINYYTSKHCKNRKSYTVEKNGTISYVRWIPSGDQSLGSYINKYGEPDTVSYSETMNKIADWYDRNIQVHFDESTKQIISVDFKESVFDVVCLDKDTQSRYLNLCQFIQAKIHEKSKAKRALVDSADY